MKFGQLIEYDKKNNFFKNQAENEAGRLVPDHYLFLKNLQMRQKQVVCNLLSIHIDGPQLGIQ